MAESYLTLTNKVLARLNEVQLTSSNFSNARGIQVQAQNAVNESVRYINQKEFQYPFNHSTKTETLVGGTVRYSIPTTAKTVDYNTFRLVKDSDLGASGGRLYVIQYNDYINSYVTQEDEIQTTTTSTTHTDSVTTITVSSTTGFDSSGTLFIGNEQVTYTGTTSTTFTGVTRGANDTTAASIASGVQVAQFESGGVPQYVARTPDNNYLLYPFPTNIVPVESNPVVLLTVTVVAESVKAPSKFVVVISSSCVM